MFYRKQDGLQAHQYLYKNRLMQMTAQPNISTNLQSTIALRRKQTSETAVALRKTSVGVNDTGKPKYW
jgi:hypothetical protein